MSSAQPAPTTDNPPQACAKCNKTANVLKNCAKCKSVLYCNRTCQTAHWKEHKKECSRMAGEREPGFSSTSASNSGSRQGPAKPFAAISNGTFLHGWSEEKTYKVLVDIIRLRQEDTYTLVGDTMAGTIYDGERSSEKAFCDMLRRAKQIRGFLPSWWSDEKEEECTQQSRAALRCAQQKSDIQEAWKDNQMPMKLRMLGEKIYGNTPGVAGSGAGQAMLQMQMMMEGGGAGGMATTHLDMAGAFGGR